MLDARNTIARLGPPSNVLSRPEATLALSMEDPGESFSQGTSKPLWALGALALGLIALGGCGPTQSVSLEPQSLTIPDDARFVILSGGEQAPAGAKSVDLPRSARIRVTRAGEVTFSMSVSGGSRLAIVAAQGAAESNSVLTIEPAGRAARGPKKSQDERGWVDRALETDPAQRFKDRHDYDYRLNPSRWYR